MGRGRSRGAQESGEDTGRGVTFSLTAPTTGKRLSPPRGSGPWCSPHSGAQPKASPKLDLLPRTKAGIGPLLCLSTLHSQLRKLIFQETAIK